MKTRLISKAIIAILFFAAVGCGKKNENPVPVQKTPTTPVDSVIDVGADVYLVGFTTGQYPDNGPNATYWKNGVSYILPDSLSLLDNQANAISVNNTGVYVVGTTHSGTIQIATLWKNSVVSKLTGSNGFSEALAITLNGNDVFAAGRATASDGNEAACYWKNGIINFMPDSTTSGSAANAVVVNGSDIYLAGYIFNFNRGHYQAAFWKNGVPTVLSNNSNGSMVFAAATNGTDVYLAGFDGNVATIWKNGVPSSLTNSLNSFAYGIAIDGNDVYVSGVMNNSAVYWKNGVATILTGNAPESYSNLANGIAVNSSNVFIAGAHTSQGYPMYWWDSKIIKVSKGNGNGMVKGIAIVPH